MRSQFHGKLRELARKNQSPCLFHPSFRRRYRDYRPHCLPLVCAYFAINGECLLVKINRLVCLTQVFVGNYRDCRDWHLPLSGRQSPGQSRAPAHKTRWPYAHCPIRSRHCRDCQEQRFPLVCRQLHELSTVLVRQKLNGLTRFAEGKPSNAEMEKCLLFTVPLASFASQGSEPIEHGEVTVVFAPKHGRSSTD